EGGLDAAGASGAAKRLVTMLADAGIRVSLFVEADIRQLDAARAMGAPVVELHTGAYCDAVAAGREEEAAERLRRLTEAARHGAEIGLEVHAGHGIAYDTVKAVARIPQIAELNIGHFLV